MHTKFNNLSLAKKLYGLAGILLVSIAALGTLAVVKLGHVDHKAAEMHDKDTAGIVATGNLIDAIGNEQRLVLRGIVYTDDAKVQREVDAELAKSDAAIRRSLASHREFAPAFDDYVELRGDVRAASRAGRADTARNLNNGLVKSFTELHGELVESGAELADEAAHSAADIHSTYTSARTETIVLILIALVVGLAGSVLVVTAIRRTVAQVLDRLGMLRDHCTTDLKAGLTAMSDGDLTITVTPVTPLIDNPSKDELGQIATAVNDIRNSTVGSVVAYNEMTEKLRGLIGDVSQSAGSVSSASQQMAATSEETGKAVGEIASAVGEVASGAERQVRGVENVKNAADEAAGAARTSAEQAQEAAGVAEGARIAAREGVEAAEQATQAMQSVRGSSQSVTEAIRELAAKSDEIGAIVETITGIAGQTNLLALNAAIEAARAGEQGRGFAVVAEEVRKLAEESQNAAGEISSLVETIQGETTRAVEVVEDGAKRTDDGVAVVEQTRSAFERIGVAVEDVNERIGQIAGAAQQISAETTRMQEDIGEVAAVAEQSSASAEQVSASTQQTSASTQEIAASAQELASTAAQLEQLVAQFKVA